MAIIGYEQSIQHDWMGLFGECHGHYFGSLQIGFQKWWNVWPLILTLFL